MIKIKTEEGARMSFFSYLKTLTNDSCIIPMTCARSALVQGLRAFNLGRMDEILVPPYMCQAVLAALSRTSFPVMTPSPRTKAILVFHQFGFPQKLAIIKKKAKENGWLIISDCAHTIASNCEGRNILDWGDFSVVSCSKIFPCVLGGAIVSSNKPFMAKVQTNVNYLGQKDKKWVEKAYKIIKVNQRNVNGADAVFEIAAVYGLLPEMVSFPSKTRNFLSKKSEVYKQDVDRRRQRWTMVQSFFPRLVPNCSGCDVVPWAIPIKGSFAKVNRASLIIKKNMGVSLPILHFDFARNMLQPGYQPALVIDCQGALTENQIIKICKELKIQGM